MNEVLKTMAERVSHRAYAPEQLTQEQLDAIMRAALQAPSAVNRQPWHFTVVQDKELLARITKAAHQQAQGMTPQQRGPRFDDPAFHLHYHAPTVIFLTAPDVPSYYLDCGIAVQQIALAAQSLGLGSVIVALCRLAFDGPEGPELARLLQFPEGNKFMISIALGTPTDHKAPHDLNEDKITYLR